MTLNRSFSEFANNVLGPGDSLLISSWPMAQRINEIHTALMGGGPDQDGLIRACGRAALDEWQDGLKTNPRAGWLDDRSYYQGIDDEVRWYQSYQAQALGYIEEAGYYRAAQIYARDYPARAPQPCADPGAVCRLALERHPEGVAAKLCRSIATEIEATRTAMGAEWQLAGVPYSNDQVVLSIPSVARGTSGNVKALLVGPRAERPSGWRGVQQLLPTRRRACPRTGDIADGRSPRPEDWGQLYGALKESGGNGVNVLTAMNTSGAFRAILPAKLTDLERRRQGLLCALGPQRSPSTGFRARSRSTTFSVGEFIHATVRCLVSA